MALSNANKETLKVLREHGDTLNKPREIMHWAYFSSDEARARFSEQCAKAGFEIQGVNDGGREPRKFSVRFTHIDIPDEGVVELFTSLLEEMAADCEGEYDGWETQVQ